MDLKQLEYFMTIVEEGNITAAAQKLFMTQPPLSNQIKMLEKELDCTLFERGARSIHLTDAGHTLYTYAKSITELAGIAKQETMSTSKKHKETLRIGIISSLISSTALSWLTEFSAEYPNIRFEIIEGNTYELINKFETNSIHLAFLRTPFNREKLHCKPIFTDEIIAIGNQKFWNSKDSTVSLSYLATVPLIMYRRWETIIQNSFQEHQISPNIFCINDDARTTLYFVEAGMGVGLVPESAITQCNEAIITKRIPELSLSSKVVLSYSSENRLPDCAHAFLSFMDRYTKL